MDECFLFCIHVDPFITCCTRAFCAPLRGCTFSPEATFHASRRLSAAAKEGDVLNALWCLAHGAIVNWANSDENGNLSQHSPPLHPLNHGYCVFFAVHGCSVLPYRVMTSWVVSCHVTPDPFSSITQCLRRMPCFLLCHVMPCH